MFRALFCTTLFVTLMVNIIFLFATKDKPPDPTAATPTALVSPIDGARAEPLAFSSSSSYSSGARVAAASPGRRLFLRSNADFYDYSTQANRRVEQEAATNDNINEEDNQSSQSSVKQLPSGQSNSPVSATLSANGSRAGKAARARTRAQGAHAKSAAAATAATPASAAADDGEFVLNVVDRRQQQAGREQLVPPTAPQPLPPQKSESTQTRPWTKQIRIDNETTRRLIRTSLAVASNVERPNGWRSLARENNKRASPSDTATEISKHKENKSSEEEAAAAAVAKELSSEITTVITRRPPSPVGSSNPDGQTIAKEKESTNTITNSNTNTNTVTNTNRVLNIRVKSSKSHVLVRVDNLIIYESGSSGTLDNQQPSDDRDKHLFQRSRRGRRARRRHVRFDRDELGNANAPSTANDAEPKEEEDGEKEQQQRPEGAMRGIHVLVLNQFDGRLMAKRSFDTYSWQQDEELALFLRQIQEGRLLVFALQDEGSFKMARSSRARKLLRRLGSQRIMELGWRDMWALITVKRIDGGAGDGGGGGGDGKRQVAGALAEGLSKSSSFSEWARPVEIEASFELAPAESERGCAFEDDSPAVRARRRAFCSRAEGYARVCDCQFPARVNLASKPIANTQIWDVPIVVLASNRPYYLYRMLRSLLSADGVDSRMITVFIDGFYDEPKWLCELLGVRYQQHAPRGARSARISHHYKTSLSATFEHLFPQAKMAILFEEDLDVARDALVYFNHTRALLERDPSLYCASAWNDQGYEHSVGAPGGLLRIETMPGLGWMLTRRLFVEELKPRWPPHTQQHDWDMWIRTAAVRRGRECVIPDVSRTYHFGSTGTNINSYFQRQYFAKHAFSGYDPSVQRNDSLFGVTTFDDIATLERDNYERLLEARLDPKGGSQHQLILGASTTAEGPDHGVSVATMTDGALCSYNSYDDKSYDNSTTLNALSRDERAAHQFGVSAAGGQQQQQQNNTQIVIYIKMIDSEDFKNWLHLAKCWRLWDLDARGQHKAMWRLYLKGRPTFVIGVPASPYAKFKPPQLLPYDF